MSRGQVIQSGPVALRPRQQRCCRMKGHPDSISARTLLRHPPLAFWAAAALFLSAAAVVLAVVDPLPERAADIPLRETRSDVMGFRSEISGLVVLARHDMGALAEKARELSDHALSQSERHSASDGAIQRAYLVLHVELDALSDTAAKMADGPSSKAPGHPDSDASSGLGVESEAEPNQAEGASSGKESGSDPVGGVSLPDRLSRVLHAADLLAAATWR